MPVRRARPLNCIASSLVNGNTAYAGIHSVSIRLSLSLGPVPRPWVRIWWCKAQSSAVTAEYSSRTEPRDLLNISAELPISQLKSVVSCDTCHSFSLRMCFVLSIDNHWAVLLRVIRLRTCLRSQWEGTVSYLGPLFPALPSIKPPFFVSTSVPLLGLPEDLANGNGAWLEALLPFLFHCNKK